MSRTDETRKNRILIVDDDPDFVEVTRVVLEAAGYRVTSAANSDEGLRQVRQARPDLVILDVIMKTVLDGLTMSREMADDPEQRSIPILMVSSIANSDYAALFPTDEFLHIDGFLSKPIAPAELLQQVKALL